MCVFKRSDGLVQVPARYILVNLEGRACFDFLKAEDKGAGESCKPRSHAGGLPCKDTAPGADRLPLTAQRLYHLP